VSRDDRSADVNCAFLELLLDQTTVDQIIAKLQTPLLHPEDFAPSIDSCARLASFVSGIIYTENSLLKSGESLLLALFQFSCADHADLEFLTKDTLWEVNTSWQDVVTVLSKNLPKQEFNDLVGKFADLVEQNFLEKFPQEGTIDTLIDAIVNFVRSVFGQQPMMITNVFDIFFKRNFIPGWKNKITELCLRAEYLTGNLTSPHETFKTDSLDVSDEQILKYFVWSYVKIAVLSSPLQNNESDDDDDEEEAKEIVYVVDDNTLLLTDLLYDVAAAQSFLTNYKMVNLSYFCFALITIPSRPDISHQQPTTTT
jgi:hypothetical protein